MGSSSVVSLLYDMVGVLPTKGDELLELDKSGDVSFKVEFDAVNKMYFKSI